MKVLIIFFSLTFILMGCKQNEEPAIQQETGVVVNYAGTDYCSIVIELDNGQRIQPHYFPEGFEFIQGQRLLVNYTELPNIVSTCGKGAVSEIFNIEVLECGSPIIETDTANLNTFPNDPLIVRNIAVNGSCLSLMVSYSGGCKHHEFDLLKVDEKNADGATAVLKLRHDANNDLCEAALSKELQFNLLSLKEAGYTKFQFNALLENGETFTEVFELEP